MKRGPPPNRAKWPKPPDALATVPPPPESLGPRGRQLWSELLGSLVPLGLVAPRDLPGLELALSAYELALEALEAVRFEILPDGTKRRRDLGEYLRGRNSQTSPELTGAIKLLGVARGYLAEYGYTPASRARVAPIETKSETEDPMEGYLRD